MKITIIGTGYVGLVTGTGLAENGHDVTCVDIDESRIAPLLQGKLPIYEPGLEELVVRNVEEERLHFTTDLTAAVEDCVLVFLCVGTPLGEDGAMDLSAVMGAAEQVAKAITGYRVIANKSTCPVGTAKVLREHIASLTDHPFDVVVNPEFLKQGAAVDDFMRPDRIVVGCDDVRVEEIMKELYTPFLRTGKPFLAMSPESAEMTKLAVNVTLATRISLMNELAGISAAVGADIGAVREAIATDSRIGPAYLFPGLGYGGSCLPKDVKSCAVLAHRVGLEAPLLEACSTVNTHTTTRFIERVLTYYGDAIGEKQIALWGLSFKPRTDDLRGAPSLRVIDALLEKGAEVVAYDPVASSKARAMYGDRIRVVAKGYEALEDADGLIIATEWNEFRRPDYERMAGLMRDKVIFDGRNLYTPAVLAKHGFRYFSIGRPDV